MAQDAQTLGRIGANLRAADLPPIRVTLPRELADRAVAAWQREDQQPIPRPEQPPHVTSATVRAPWPSSAWRSPNEANQTPKATPPSTSPRN